MSKLNVKIKKYNDYIANIIEIENKFYWVLFDSNEKQVADGEGAELRYAMDSARRRVKFEEKKLKATS